MYVTTMFGQKQYLCGKTGGVKDTMCVERDIRECVHFSQLIKDLLHGINDFIDILAYLCTTLYTFVFHM